MKRQKPRTSTGIATRRTPHQQRQTAYTFTTKTRKYLALFPRTVVVSCPENGECRLTVRVKAQEETCCRQCTDLVFEAYRHRGNFTDKKKKRAQRGDAFAPTASPHNKQRRAPYQHRIKRGGHSTHRIGHHPECLHASISHNSCLEVLCRICILHTIYRSHVTAVMRFCRVCRVQSI